MTRLMTISLVAVACVFTGAGCAQMKPKPHSGAAVETPAPMNRADEAVPARMDAKWVSAIVGMKIETPDGARLGRVQDVVMDGYGRASFAIVSYGGLMGVGTRYTAVPWAAVAEMLDREKLLMDRTNLENSPMLSSAKPQATDKDWRQAAESYWAGRVASAQ